MSVKRRNDAVPAGRIDNYQCAAPEKETGLRSRLAGDGLDVATLLAAFRYDNPKKDNVALALLMVAGVTLLDLVGAQGTAARHARYRGRQRLYYDRSGFPKGSQAAKGIAKDFHVPLDMRAAPSLPLVGDRSPA